MRKFTAPRPQVLLLAGPDGTGKSSVATRLQEEVGVARREHYRPFPPRESSAAVAPHGEQPRSTVSSILKLAWLWVEQWQAVGRRRRCKAPLVIIERGFWDQAVDPERYRLPVVAVPLVRVLGTLLPRADLAVLLSGPAELVHHRKPELPVREIAEQTDRWRTCLPRAGVTHLELSVTQPVDELVAQVVTALSERDRKSPWTS